MNGPPLHLGNGTEGHTAAPSPFLLSLGLPGVPQAGKDPDLITKENGNIFTLWSDFTLQKPTH